MNLSNTTSKLDVNYGRDFSGGSVVKNPHAGQWMHYLQFLLVDCQRRRPGFDPWSGKIPHASEQLSPCTSTIKSVLCSLGGNYWNPCTLKPMLHKRSHQNEKRAHHN